MLHLNLFEVFGGVCVFSIGFRIFCWYRGFCHRTGSDLLLFLFQYLLKLVFTMPIQIVSKLYLVDLIFILLIFKEQVRWFSVEAKRKEFNCVINEDIAYDMTM